ncbi:MAG: hypothetical protein LUG51_01515 [Tannerellaceae bacterium]|nr:hypothetical protein [Tannerellaceae bacterium]
MKIKHYLLSGLIALGLGMTSCSKDDVNELAGEGEGSMAITLEGSSSTRAIGPVDDVTDSKIHDFYVYVFAWNSGALEKAVKGDIAKSETVITGLKTNTTKRVVVLTNLGETYPADITNYADFDKATKYLNLDKQTPELAKTNGYIMSGVSDNQITLTKDQTVKTGITLKRVVAKVSLGSITVSPEEGTEIDDFKITGVSVQRVAPDLTLSPVASHYVKGSGGYHYGGFESDDDELEIKSYLADDIIMEDALVANRKYDFNNYFLVFPNKADESICTLLTIRGELDGETLYYPIKVNYKAGEVNTDGMLIEHNKHYQLNVTLKNIKDGVTDPELPGEDANLQVTVTLEPWDTLVQNEVW